MTGSPEPVWSPSPETIESSSLTAYTSWLEGRTGLEFTDYEALWRWSVEDIDAFWRSIWDYFEVAHSGEVGDVTLGSPMPGTRWFEGAEVNFAEHVFRARDPELVAIHAAAEDRPIEEVTWGELERRVAGAAEGLRRLGVVKGDRVVAYLPNSSETVVSFLATASIGAIWSSCSPEFGTGAVRDRFAQVEPVVLIAADGYRYGGRDFDRREEVVEVASSMPSLERVVVIPGPGSNGQLPETGNAIAWKESLGLPPDGPLTFERVPFSHPLWVLYSSGTTGLPKAIVQGQGGILLEHLKKMHLHLDAGPEDRIFWFTTTGWMMWNFLVSCLLTGAGIVLYDGSPGYPDMGALWDLAAETGVTCFGTSAAFISACMKDEVHPAEGRNLDRLRSVGSTGSPLSPEAFDWIYRELGDDIWLFSTSGGTDLCTAFVGGVPTLPVFRGELQGRALGAAVEAWDEEGNPVTGEVGELVLTKPMPSMPLFLWGDEDGTRLRESYFDHYPGIWRHGDWIELTERGTAIIYGRSDSTINRGGIRMGTSEIYRVVLDQPGVVDALVVDLPKEGTEGWMMLFVVPEGDNGATPELGERLKSAIRERCSPRHVPDEVVAIEEVPRTLSGKVLEVPVKRILTGTPPSEAASPDSLANPASLDFFADLAGRTG
ncbi:MAG: acetoacetate--CoA ligase [Solirubrobacterales bacterium]